MIDPNAGRERGQRVLPVVSRWLGGPQGGLDLSGNAWTSGPTTLLTPAFSGELPQNHMHLRKIAFCLRFAARFQTGAFSSTTELGKHTVVV